MSALLWPAARLWSLAARARVELYRRGAFKQRRLARPVVSVGNISAGGAGKTPFVIWLFSELAARGYRPSVLTRGYRRPPGPDTLLVLGCQQDGSAAGDEVQVMMRHGVAPIAVDADRFRAGSALEAQPGGVSLHILDDGFQHLALARDLDIVLVDTSRPPWKDDLLPAGRLREPPSALGRADVLVLTRVQDWARLDELTGPLRDLAPRADIYLARTRLAGQAAHPGDAGNRGSSPGSVLQRPALAFAGIGNPKAFLADLCLAGIQVVGAQSFPDHHRYTAADLERLERSARSLQAQFLITTEKDAANLPSELLRRLELPLRVMRMELEVERGGDLVDRVEKLIRQ